MDQTPNLHLPYIMPSQAQKHVTHNEAIRALDALVQMAVLNRDLATPPVSPAEGDRYLVAFGGLGAWSGKDGFIAAWQDGAWAYFMPASGWLVWVADEGRLLCHDGAAFVDAAVHSVNPALLIGVNATADATDRLSVKSPASLFDNESGDHRMKINKAAAGDTASVLFQSGYSGRAEFGLTGDEDWTVKVSADGAAWVSALKVDRATGRIRLPAALALGDDDQVVASRHVRQKLAANRTYYVRIDGSDANSGLVDSSSEAFLTIQKAIDTAAALDLSIYEVTIQLAAGAYATGVGNILKSYVGAGAINIVGDATTPANVTVDLNLTGSANAFTATSVIGVYRISGVKFTATGTGTKIAISATAGSTVEFGNVDFGAGYTRHVQASDYAYIRSIAPYTISAGAGAHIRVTAGEIRINGIVTLTGAPAFSVAFGEALIAGVLILVGNTFVGSATGVRYSASSNAVIYTAGASATHLPGDAAGSTATGAQYI